MKQKCDLCGSEPVKETYIGGLGNALLCRACARKPIGAGEQRDILKSIQKREQEAAK